MKKCLSLLGIAVLALLLAVPAFAAAKPIEVYINGSKVSFNAGSPYLQNNTVMVPFRAVFLKLGLEVLSDAKTGTVTGTSSDLVIKLKIGSNRASINGIVQKLNAVPVTVGNVTYIPLRFISDATKGTFSWNPVTRSVQITTLPSKEQDTASITALFRSMVAYYNEENAAGIKSLMNPNSAFSEYASTLQSTFDSFGFKSILDDLNILSIRANEAIVSSTETSLHISGPYIPDQQEQYLYTLSRLNGTWKISDIQLMQSAVLLSTAEALKPAVMPQSELTSINGVLSTYYKALNGEDIDGVTALMTSYGEESDTQVSLSFQQLFSQYNIKYIPGVSNVYYYNGSEAAVYAEQKTQESDANDVYEQGIIYILSKTSSGEWTIDRTYNVFDELSHS
ncbi:copper amine oxidase N-terminal domain-containing protein [Paenibacillus sp. sgz500958]|uniref:copper amine oxidase N-terminal domain-containing protein n=1 Tax=Paenibacillus sp. sgz500958 TaxID=3242475 RepID=UPI0036D4049D